MGDEVEFDGHIFFNAHGRALLCFDRIVLTAKCQLPGEIGKRKAGKITRGVTTLNPVVTLLTNVAARKKLVMQFEFIRQIRDFFSFCEFIDVDTPILHEMKGGALAKPFITQSNELGRDTFLRIATEIELKTLVILGFDKVFEIGHQFRNESADDKHNPELTSIEFYETGADYNDMMRYTEDVIRDVSRKIMDVEFTTVDFSGSFERYTNITVDELLRDYNTAAAACRSLNVEFGEEASHAKLIDLMFEKLVEPTFSTARGHYTFVTNHPIIMSPLAKAHDNHPHLAQRFELYYGGMEIANGYTEQNDPDVQLAAFKSQSARDPEAMPVNDKFIHYLRYGLPMLAGCGIGIDRLLMILTDSTNIKDVIVRL